MQKFLFIFLFSLCLAVNTEQIYENSYALIIDIDKYENEIAQASIDPNSDAIGIKPMIGLGFISPLKIFNTPLPIIKSFTFGYRFVPKELEQVGVSSGPTVALRVGRFSRKYQENYVPN